MTLSFGVHTLPASKRKLPSFTKQRKSEKEKRKKKRKKERQKEREPINN